MDYPVAICQYFSWMKIFPITLGVAILKLYNGKGKGRNVAFVGPQDVQKSSLLRAMLMPLTEHKNNFSAVGTIPASDTSRFCFENATAKNHVLCQIDDITPEGWKSLGTVLGPLDGNIPTFIEIKYDLNRRDTFAPVIATSNFDPSESDPRLLTRFKVFHFKVDRVVVNAKLERTEKRKTLLSFLEGWVDEESQINEMRCETASFFFLVILLLANAYKSPNKECLFNIAQKIFGYNLSENEWHEIAVVANQQKWGVEFDREKKTIAIGCTSEKQQGEEPERIALTYNLKKLCSAGESYLRRVRVVEDDDPRLLNDNGLIFSSDED